MSKFIELRRKIENRIARDHEMLRRLGGTPQLTEVEEIKITEPERQIRALSDSKEHVTDPPPVYADETAETLADLHQDSL